MQEIQVWFLGCDDPLEKGMATHSSILAWEIPWTEKPGWLQSMGSQSWIQLRDKHFDFLSPSSYVCLSNEKEALGWWILESYSLLLNTDGIWYLIFPLAVCFFPLFHFLLFDFFRALNRKGTRNVNSPQNPEGIFKELFKFVGSGQAKEIPLLNIT